MTSGDGVDDEDDGAQVGDVESVLGLFTARGLPQRMLRWHYRSRHQSLIAVSNSEFYQNKLYIVPSPYTAEAGMGLRFHHLPSGVFDSGGTGTNAVEAKAVAEAVIRHAKEQPNESLGVATFSVRQRRAIQDELERLRRLNPDTEGFFHSHPTEPFFVKNLENVQGDERDAIFISVGYGRNAQDYMAMRFGPLSAEGGERRLNVLISRAKRRCEVFSSITDEDIDLERGKGKGVVAFKLFLHFARTRRLSIAQTTARGHDSLFEEQVAKALAKLGYQVHPQVGIAGFFIDLAVADQERPGRYLLGIECDGASYHSSRSARDRDRLRQSVLEDHGWHIHRVWSTDWFQRPKEQLDRAVAAIEAAKAELGERSGRTAARAVPVEVVTIERADVTEVGLEDTSDRSASIPPYAEASFQVPSSAHELHDTPVYLLADIARQVIVAEGPVHAAEVTSRIRSLWGLQRSGGRIQSAVDRAIQSLVRSGEAVDAAGFLSLPGTEVRLRNRSGVASLGLRQPSMLPPAEIEVAIRRVVSDNLGASGEEIATGVARLFGFKATSSQLRDVIGSVLAPMIASGRLVQNGDHYELADPTPAERREEALST
jgi:very-short-patch-repair endonuclease